MQDVHCQAETSETTDCRQIPALYDQLYAVLSAPAVGRNRASASAEFAGPASGLELAPNESDGGLLARQLTNLQDPH
jgi:predicted RNA polymerase sigma factor